MQGTYQNWKNSVLGKRIGNGECVALVVNTPQSYVEALFPGVPWQNIIPPVRSAKQMANKSNQYLTWVANNHNDPNQLPPVGAIMVFDATPESGYTNTFNNPDGHCGVNDGANSSGYYLCQQNSPQTGSPANVTFYAWKYRPCLGWYTISGSAPTPAPAPAGKTITLPPTTGPWHLYAQGYAGSLSHVIGILVPANFGGLTYPIIASLGNGVYRIDSKDYGIGDLWTNGSSIIIK